MSGTLKTKPGGLDGKETLEVRDKKTGVIYRATTEAIANSAGPPVSAYILDNATSSASFGYGALGDKTIPVLEHGAGSVLFGVNIAAWNVLLGLDSASSISGHSNVMIGIGAGDAVVGSTANVYIGRDAGSANVSGGSNTIVGSSAGQYLTAGSSNTFIGVNSGRNVGLTSVIGSICIGAKSGEEIANDEHYRLYISSINNADKTEAIIYGEQVNDTPANQMIRFNAAVEMPVLKSGATQVAAGAAANELWVTDTHASLPNNVVMIGV